MSTYALLKPSVFGTRCFAYAVTTASLADATDVSLDLVLSGTLADVSAASTTRSVTEVRARGVSAEEALSGIATYVGTYICVQRSAPDGALMWDYGVVAAYAWDRAGTTGALSVIFGDDRLDVRFDPGAFQLVAAETYLLAPCRSESVLNIMYGEMCAINTAVYEAFTGVGRQATRYPRTVFSQFNLDYPAETGAAPLYDTEIGRVRKVAVKYALDFLYYASGRRRAVPKTVRLGESLFDEARAVGPVPAATDGMRLRSASGRAAAERVDLAESSDEDDVPLPMRLRGSSPVRDAPRAVTTTRQRAPDPAASSLAADLEALIQTHGRDAVIAEQRAQFCPTAVQTAIHQLLTNGTSHSLAPQVLLESLQARANDLRFLLHPGILRGLDGWDFGLRGLSVRHFARLTEDQLAAASANNHMVDFSLKNKTPAFTEPASLNALMQCVDCLIAASSRIYRGEVSTLLLAARAFLLDLESSDHFGTPASLSRLARWLDQRLEAFRSHVAEDRWDDASQIHLTFDSCHSSFVRLQQTLADERLRALQSALHQPRTSPSAPPVKGHSQPSPRIPTVPAAVLALLPHQDGKTLCMRFLSRNGCRGRYGGCFVDDRGHFVPASLPKLVRDHIQSKLGGLKPNLPIQ